MLEKLKAHLSDNAGDANVSKMTWVAIVFVIGAILLVLVTSAFRNPINRWFDKVTAGWFADENGEFDLMLNMQPIVYEKNENGTIKGLKYAQWDDLFGCYCVLDNVESLVPGSIVRGATFTTYDENWNLDGGIGSFGSSGMSYVIEVSADGNTVTFRDGDDVEVFTTVYPE